MHIPPALLVVTTWLCQLDSLTEAIKCHECEDEMAGVCNGGGECIGSACVKIENSKNGQTSVRKGCTDALLESRCTAVKLHDGSLMRKCTCVYDWCNHDSELEQSGLVVPSNSAASTDRTKRVPGAGSGRMSAGFGLTLNYIIMLVFLCLFVSGSFGLLLMNTVCVHLC